MAMPHWHFALCWWIAFAALSVVSLVQGRFALAAVALGAFLAGVALLCAFREYGRAVLSCWRLVLGVFLSTLAVLLVLLVSSEHLDDLTYVFLSLPLVMAPGIWLFSRLSRTLSGKLPPNSSLKRTNQSLRD